MLKCDALQSESEIREQKDQVLWASRFHTELAPVKFHYEIQHESAI